MVDIYEQFKDFKAFEVTFFNEKQELQKILCNVKSIENNRIFLEANNQKNHNVFAEVGEELKLYIYTENGIYSATSKVLLANKGIINTEYIISYPANSKHSQRREYFRADMSVEFKMKITDINQNVSVINSKTRNICGKGMSYVADSPFPEHELIEIDLFFNEKAVNTHATFVYSKQIVIGNHPKFIQAFTFTTISQKNIDFIVKKCFLHQLDLRRKQQSYS